MNTIQEMIEIQWKESFCVELPNQRFFKPKASFWEILKSLELKCLVDCGCGNGELVKEGIDLGFKISGCDIHKRDGVQLGLVQIVPAHKIPFNNEIHALVCRPDHSGWCPDLITHSINKGSKFIYVGLKDNLYRDIPEDISYKVLSENVGEENEVMILIESCSPKTLKAYQVGDNDVVAAYDEEEAVKILCEYSGCLDAEDFEKSDVTDLTSKLHVMLKDEEGNDIETLGDWLKRVNEPEYLYGWE